MATDSTPKKERVIPFSLLYDDSVFTIKSEPSRGIRESTDKRFYRKVSDAYSVAVSPTWPHNPVEPEVVCILRPNDLVRPVARPNTRFTSPSRSTTRN